MGMKSNPNGANAFDWHSNRSHGTMYTDDPQTSPLDLSTRRQSPFAYRSMSIDESPSSPPLTPVEVNAYMQKQMSVDCGFDAPKILTQPKTEWHYRSMKDLLNKHIPLLSGVGRQRTPILVSVPRTSTEQMYLVLSVVTYDKKPHLSKVIVPSKTTVTSSMSLRNNDLDCLNFKECDPMEYFDPNSWQIYLPITREEHIAEVKEVRVHMFNLYQSEFITKDLIETRRLHQCHLAFWLCYRQAGQEIRISSSTFSELIQEKKHASARRVLQKENINHDVFNSYSMVPNDSCMRDCASSDSESDSA